MWLLLAALFATIIGPPIYALAKQNAALKKSTDTFILIVTAGIIIFQVLPETFAELGIWSIVLAIVGTGLPGVIEFLFRKAAQKTHLLTLTLGVLGLMLHGVVDGCALTLADYNNTGGKLLPIAILLHRTPISLTLWWLVKPEFGTRVALMVIMTLLLGTILGYLYSEQLITSLQQPSFMAFEALVAGTLLHVLYHRPGHQHEHHQNSGSHKHEQTQLVIDKPMIIGSLLALFTIIILLNLHEIVG